MQLIINGVLRKYVETICRRDCIPYAITTVECGEISLEISTQVNVDELLEDALCEQQRDQTNAKLPVYSFRTLRNKEKLERLMDYYGKKGVHVLKEDEKKCREAGLI